MIRRSLIIIYFSITLISCAPTASIATQTSLPLSPLDGIWDGTGKAVDGKRFTIKLIVQNESLAGILYSFIGTNGLPCKSIEYGQIPVEQRLSITDDQLNGDIGDDLNLTASFMDLESASGYLTIHWQDRQPYCNGDYQVDWAASKQKEQPVQTGPYKNSNKPSPLETLIQILVFGLSNGAVLALNAIGVTIIYGTARTLNLAHGDVFALTTALVTSIVNIIGIRENWLPFQLVGGLFFVFILAMLLGAILSMGVEFFGFAPFRGASRLGPLIATLGLSFILFQGALVWRTYQGSWIPGEHRSVPGLPEVPTDGIPSFLPEINLVKYFGLPIHMIIRFSDVFVIFSTIILVAFANWFIQKTRTGGTIRAVSQNQQMAQILGININLTIRRAFAIGGAFAGAAGFIFALYYSRPFGFHGAQSGLFAFMAALLGGIGNPIGALVSGLLIGAVSSLSDYFLAAQWTPVLLLAILISLFVWKPTGFVSDEAGEVPTVIRDSVILTAPTQGFNSKRWLIILLLILLFFPLFIQSGQVILRLAGIFIILTLSLNIALGIAGLLDLGVAASFGFSAYLTALLVSKFDITFALLAGAGAGALLGWIKGGLARRLRSDFFAVATLAFGLLIRQIIVNLDFTGGMGGIGAIPAPHILGISLASQLQKYNLVLFIIALVSWLSHRLISSRTGREWIALSEDELAALSLGVNVNRLRISALMLSSALAGMAGVLYASTLSFV